MKKLTEIQQGLKAPKNQYNDFGKYNYRSCEDILEAVKPLLNGCLLTITDAVIEVGGRIYVAATVTIETESRNISVTAYARESETKKGMDAAQITGSASSYARKYALNGLFLIDDTKDADANIADGNSYQKNKPEQRPRTTTQNNDPERSGKNLQGEITKPQKGKLWAMMKEQGMDDKQAGAFFAFKNPTTKNDASEFIENFDVYLTEYMETLDGK